MKQRENVSRSVVIQIIAILSLCTLVLANAEDDRSAGMYLGASSSTSLGCVTGAAPDPVRGLTLGCTFFEHQKHGSMGRQIAAVCPDCFIHFTWTNQDNNSALAGRNVRWEGFDPATGALGDGTGGIDVAPDLILPNRAGRITIAPLNNGQILTGFDWNWSFGTPASKFESYSSVVPPGIGEWLSARMDTSVWQPLIEGNATVFRYPKVALSEPPFWIHHAVLSSNRTDGDNLGIYTRRFTQDDWESPVLLGLAGYHQSFIITSSKQSQRVAIAWSGGRGDGTEFGASVSRYNNDISGKNDNDIYVMTSEDAGVTWSAVRNVTRRTSADPGGWAPHAKLSILYDEADSAHVVWQALEWVGYDGNFNTRSRMFHWGENRNTVRTAVEANWDPTLCNGGENTLNLDNPQLSACDNKLYLTYTQFAPVPLGRGDDCGLRASLLGEPLGAANGDIYVSVSSDGGLTWDSPRNLTDTYTPSCDTLSGAPFPDCDSDVWHSVIRYGIDMTGLDFDAITDLSANIDATFAGSEFLVAQYINDSDPGAAIRSEGGWTNNNVYAFRFGCVEQEASAVLASSLPEASVFVVPEILIPAIDTTFNWVLENIGAVDITGLTISITNNIPPNSIVITGFGAMLNSGANNSDTGVVSLNANGIPLGVATADLVVDGSFVGAPKTFSLSFILSPAPCCIAGGDVNGDTKVGIADVTFLIARIFAGGPEPECCDEADANGNGKVNIADITYLIARIFAGGPPPVCGPAGIGC